MTSWKRRRNSWCFPHPVKTVPPHATRKHIRLHQDDAAAWRDQCRVGCNLQVVRSNGRYAGWQAQYRRTLERGRPPASALGTNLTGNGYIAWDPYYHNIPWPKQICNEKQYNIGNNIILGTKKQKIRFQYSLYNVLSPHVLTKTFVWWMENNILISQ